MKRTIPALVLICLALTTLGHSQTPAAPRGVPALQFSHPEHSGLRAWDVEYVALPDGNEPAFRIRVHHYHGWCNGYLYITPTRIAYDPVFTPAQKDGFSVTRAELQDPGPRFTGYQLSLPGKTFKFAFLSDPAGSNASEDQRAALLKFIALAVTNFGAAQQSFLATLAGLPAPAADGALVLPAQPLIRILNPPGVQPGATADATGATQSVVGVVAVTGGIRAVTANDRPATITPLTPDIALFQTPAFVLPAGTTPLKISVVANNNSTSDFAFNATRPEIVITEPAGNVRTEAVTLHGTVIGLHDVEKVNVAGKPVELQQRADGAFDFAVPNVPLEMGANAITGYAVESNGQRPVFDAVVTRIPPQKALTLQQIESGLRSGVSASAMLALVQSRGVDFELTPQMERRLRGAGANDALLDAINEGYNK